MRSKYIFTQMLAVQSKVEFANFHLSSIFAISTGQNAVPLILNNSYKTKANKKTTLWNHFRINFQMIETDFCQAGDLIALSIIYDLENVV